MPTTVKPWHRWPPGLRATIFARDNWECQIQGPNCTHRATEIDHKVSPLNGGAWFDPDNLQAACKVDNREKGHRPPTYPEYPTDW